MYTIISQLLTSPQSMLLSVSDAALAAFLRGFGFALGMRLDVGTGVPVRAAPEAEGTDGVGVGAGR